jgi:hypothetical protein
MVGAGINDAQETAVWLRFSKETFQGSSNNGFQLSHVLYSRLGRHKEEHRGMDIGHLTTFNSNMVSRLIQCMICVIYR